jgi:hypothetical protein
MKLLKPWPQREVLLQRALEIIPGFMIWVLILSPFWAGKLFPEVMASLLILLSVYWLYRALITTVGSTIGLYRAKRDSQLNWLEKCLNLAEYDLPQPEDLPIGQFLPKHLLVYAQRVPNYDVLKSTLSGIKQQNYPLELIYISVSFEERSIIKMPAGEADEIIARLKADFTDFGDRLMFFVHPDGLPGEVIGAAANRTWGTKSAVQELNKRGEVINDFLVTAPDEDVVFHPQYMAACTYKYLTSDKRKQKFYQTALYTFNNNYWDVPILIRVLMMSLTLPVLASSVTELHKRETYSCYTLSLEVMVAVNYWDVSYGIDDTTFYWRPYFYFHGDWYCEVFFVPLSADAVYDTSYVRNHREQYKQYLRWGWGVVSFPIGMHGLLKNRTIPLWTKLVKAYHLFEVFIFWKVLAYLLTFAIPIIFFINPNFNELSIWYSMPNTLSTIMQLSLLFILPNTIYKALIAPPKPQNWSWFKYLAILLIEAPMNILTLFIFSTLPFVEASTRFMIGQKEAKSVTWSTKVRV